MKTRLILAAVALASVCHGSDESLARGIIGEYRRDSFGLYSETVSLRSDRTYVFTYQFDMGSFQERGLWAIRDAVLLLTPKEKDEPNMSWPSRFRIVVVAGDLALSAVRESEDGQADEDSRMRIFRPVKKRANQSPEPTAMLVTPRAEPRVAPSTAVAHL